jgi:hypothetical protein
VAEGEDSKDCCKVATSGPGEGYRADEMSRHWAAGFDSSGRAGVSGTMHSSYFLLST